MIVFEQGVKKHDRRLRNIFLLIFVIVVSKFDKINVNF